MGEWLRRQTRNLLGCSRAGSNPTDYVNFNFNFCIKTFNKLVNIVLTIYFKKSIVDFTGKTNM